ncbi:MAG: hypothetical protein NTW30_05485 [Candidatus Aenigmarchaeota archaeon]|nr:hypothetical protein [Candidatus Aenigmarchaeota archaeon]
MKVKTSIKEPSPILTNSFLPFSISIPSISATLALKIEYPAPLSTKA